MSLFTPDPSLAPSALFDTYKAHAGFFARRGRVRDSRALGLGLGSGHLAASVSLLSLGALGAQRLSNSNQLIGRDRAGRWLAYDASGVYAFSPDDDDDASSKSVYLVRAPLASFPSLPARASAALMSCALLHDPDDQVEMLLMT